LLGLLGSTFKPNEFVNIINQKIMTEKNVKPKEVKEEDLTLKVDGACGHCGKKGFKVKLVFCSPECKQAFIAK
ncbi:hypothetical protein LCGC14_3158070, partial [marine sediment metagenome]